MSFSGKLLARAFRSVSRFSINTNKRGCLALLPEISYYHRVSCKENLLGFAQKIANFSSLNRLENSFLVQSLFITVC